MNRALKTLLACLVTTGCLQISEPSRAAEIPVTSWCYQWQHYGDEPNQPAVPDNQRFMFHLGYFLSKSDEVRDRITKQTHLDQSTINQVMTCYEENTPTLVWGLDNACNKQADDKKVEHMINGYINWCIQQKTKTA